MRPLEEMELLTIWEHGLNQTMLERALTLLVAACPDIKPEVIAQWSIGQRDARLLTLREWMFGVRLTNTAQCPQCNERVEWECSTADILVQPMLDEPVPPAFDLDLADYSVCFRLPTSKDIAGVMASASCEPKPEDLLQRCVVYSRHAGMDCDPGDLPREVLHSIEQRIGDLDPQADVRIDLHCPQCANTWNVLFDIVRFLWIEIDQWAERTLRAVHQLASAYGWSEQDILNLSPLRRQLYLGLISQ